MVIPMRGDGTEVMSMLMRRSNKSSMTMPVRDSITAAIWSMRISISISIWMIMMLVMIYAGADAWTTAPATKSATLTSRFRRNPTSPTTTRRLLVIVHQAGFGSSASNKKTASSSSSSSASSASSSPAAAASVIKLKPKQQWDRYLDLLKKETPVPVAVRVTKPNSSTSASVSASTPSSPWLAVGYVKSVDSAWTEVAVAKQRALIAEHAKRLFPLQISTKDRVEWGYGTATTTATTPTDETNQETTYTVVDVKAVDQRNDLPSSIEKMIGFQGSPDPKTGYYCVYNEGRIVTGSGNSDFTSNKKGTSKKLS